VSILQKRAEAYLEYCTATLQLTIIGVNGDGAHGIRFELSTIAGPSHVILRNDGSAMFGFANRDGGRDYDGLGLGPPTVHVSMGYLCGCYRDSDSRNSLLRNYGSIPSIPNSSPIPL
jgi:hypothetical protein